MIASLKTWMLKAVDRTYHNNNELIAVQDITLKINY